PVRQVQRRIVRAGHPDRSAAVLPRLARPCLAASLAGAGNRVEAPELAAALRIIGGDKSADAVLAAADADNHLVLDDVRRQRDSMQCDDAVRTLREVRRTADGPRRRLAGC